MSPLQTLVDIPNETQSFSELASRVTLPVEPRCRVCRNDNLRKKVNDLLARGTSYAMILRSLEADNAKLDKRDQVTIDSIRAHTRRHFPVQNVARATNREILERRAAENGMDFVNAVATAITPIAFYETVMVKGYETLVDSESKVDVATGMIAAGRLQAMVESRAARTSMVDILVKMDRIIRAIKTTVPEPMWEEILRKIDDVGPVDATVHDFDDYDRADDEYDAAESA